MAQKSGIYRETLVGARLIVRLMHVIMPFQLQGVRNVATQLGYVPLLPEGQRAGLGLEVISGRIARREDLDIEYSEEKQVLGVIGVNPEKASDAFSQLMVFIEKELGSNNLKPFFYETTISSLVEGAMSPLETFASPSNGLKKAADLDKIFKQNVSPFGLRFAPSNGLVDATDWFEYRIEPFVPKPDKLYNIILIYRNKRLDQVKKSINEYSRINKSLIRMLEGKSK